MFISHTDFYPPPLHLSLKISKHVLRCGSKKSGRKEAGREERRKGGKEGGKEGKREEGRERRKDGLQRQVIHTGRAF